MLNIKFLTKIINIQNFNLMSRYQYKKRITPELEKKLSEVFDNTNKPDQSMKETSETGLSIVENIPSFEVTKNIFGKEKVRRVK